MERLIHDLGENSAEGYDQIYLSRKERGVDAFDLKRWKKLLRYYRGSRILDAGCLDSLVPTLAKEMYPDAEVWGIDVASEAIKNLKKENPHIIYDTADVYKTDFPNNYFGYIVAGELIEHLDDPHKFIKEAMRILKRGGILALSTPKDEKNEPGAVDGHRHLWSFSLEDMYDLMGEYGDVWTRTMGSQYFPYIYHWPTIVSFVCKK